MNYNNVDYGYIGRILEGIHPSITIADGNGRFVYVGKSCRDYFGVEPERILGRAADNPEILDIFKPCVTQMVYEKQERIVTVQKNFVEKETLVTGIPVFSEEGKLELILCFSSWEIDSYEDLKRKYNHLKMENDELVTRLHELSRKEYMNSNLIGKSRKFRDTERLLKIFSGAACPAFVYGPRGCGKKYLAKMAYGSAGMVFEYNCDLLNEETLERELFSGKDALFSAGDRTLLIQNIDRLTPRLQKELIARLRHSGIVVIGIAESSLEELRRQEKITEEFYNHFISYQVPVYALVDRSEDLNAFIEYYVGYYNSKYGRCVHFTPRSMNALLNYGWPENINEVKATMERIVLTADSEKVDVYQLPGQISRQSADVFTDNTPLKDMMDFYEKGIIARAYERYHTTVAVARQLGISQASAARKIRKYVQQGSTGG